MVNLVLEKVGKRGEIITCAEGFTENSDLP